MFQFWLVVWNFWKEKSTNKRGWQLEWRPRIGNSAFSLIKQAGAKSHMVWDLIDYCSIWPGVLGVRKNAVIFGIPLRTSCWASDFQKNRRPCACLRCSSSCTVHFCSLGHIFYIRRWDNMRSGWRYIIALALLFLFFQSDTSTWKVLRAYLFQVYVSNFKKKKWSSHFEAESFRIFCGSEKFHPAPESVYPGTAGTSGWVTWSLSGVERSYCVTSYCLWEINLDGWISFIKREVPRALHGRCCGPSLGR